MPCQSIASVCSLRLLQFRQDVCLPLNCMMPVSRNAPTRIPFILKIENLWLNASMDPCWRHLFTCLGSYPNPIHTKQAPTVRKFCLFRLKSHDSCFSQLLPLEKMPRGWREEIPAHLLFSLFFLLSCFLPTFFHIAFICASSAINRVSYSKRQISL